MKQLLTKLDILFTRDIDQLPPEGMDNLPTRLWPFIWFFVRQIKGLLLIKLGLEMAAAIFLSALFWFVSYLAGQAEFHLWMLAFGTFLLLGFWGTENIITGVYHLIYMNSVGNIIRRQLYWLTARQSLSFFQNDFAGRIANKLLQSAPALRDAMETATGPVWYVVIFTISNLVIMGSYSMWLVAVMVVWLACYIGLLVHYMPRIQARSAVHAEDMSQLTGQVVDTFSNFLTIKFFARESYEDKRTVKYLRNHAGSMREIGVKVFALNFWARSLCVMLLVAVTMVCGWLVNTGQQEPAVFALALPMALQAVFQSGWIMREISGFFENLGRVQEGMEALSKPRSVVDVKDAKSLKVTPNTAGITFKAVSFNYGRQEDVSVLEDFSLEIKPGQKIGLVGRSGAGKSTVMSLLLRAYDLGSGHIEIAGQDIAKVQQATLRRAITIVTQDSYMFHRSIRENITYGHPDASQKDIEDVARRANAHEFILGLQDDKGRTGYDAHVGERGVKLSGGQRQRIGIARALLKQAPILLLDEATSALDSESELSIQNALEDIMADKTVIAIAHRLSTLRQMDRIIVMDKGCIIEDGSHQQLLRKKGHYAELWSMQSGGFLQED